MDQSDGDITMQSSNLKRGMVIGGPPASSPKISNQEFSLRISFINPEDSFINTSWLRFNTALLDISKKWEFIAFGANHKSALLNVKSAQTAELLKKVKTINSNQSDEDIIQIKIEDIKTTSKRGIIFNKFLIPFSNEQLSVILKNQGISDFFRIQKSNSTSGEKFYTGSIIIVFDTDITPDTLLVANIKIPVSILTPRPMICHHCGLVGHTKLYCLKKEQELCNSCFYNHPVDTICKKICKQCNGKHFSNDSECPILIQEFQIIKIKESHNINYFDAKAIVANSKATVKLDIQETITLKNQELINRNKALIEITKQQLKERDEAISKLEKANEEIVELKCELNKINLKVEENKSFVEQCRAQLAEREELVSQLEYAKVEINTLNENIEKLKYESVENTQMYQHRLAETETTLSVAMKKNQELTEKQLELLEENTNTIKTFSEFVNFSAETVTAYGLYNKKRSNEKRPLPIEFKNVRNRSRERPLK